MGRSLVAQDKSKVPPPERFGGSDTPALDPRRRHDPAHPDTPSD